MKVTVLTATVQEFGGTRYYLCGRYYQRKGTRLHRLVWEHHNGRIPTGYHVHHADSNPANNQIENLRLVLRTHHLSAHTKARPGNRLPDSAREAAARWHRSDQGREWHKTHYERHGSAMRQKKSLVCEHCGMAYEATKGRFCSNNCKSAWRRAQKKDSVVRTVCPMCGAEFMTDKYRPSVTCSKLCGAKLRSRASQRREDPMSTA